MCSDSLLRFYVHWFVVCGTRDGYLNNMKMTTCRWCVALPIRWRQKVIFDSRLQQEWTRSGLSLPFLLLFSFFLLFSSLLPSILFLIMEVGVFMPALWFFYYRFLLWSWLCEWKMEKVAGWRVGYDRGLKLVRGWGLLEVVEKMVMKMRSRKS